MIPQKEAPYESYSRILQSKNNNKTTPLRNYAETFQQYPLAMYGIASHKARNLIKNLEIMHCTYCTAIPPTRTHSLMDAQQRWNAEYFPEELCELRKYEVILIDYTKHSCSQPYSEACPTALLPRKHVLNRAYSQASVLG